MPRHLSGRLALSGRVHFYLHTRCQVGLRFSTLGSSSGLRLGRGKARWDFPVVHQRNGRASGRSIYSSNSSEMMMAAPFFLAPFLVVLKSGTALKVLATVSRIAIALVAPLRLGSRRILRYWHGEDHIEAVKAEARAQRAEGMKVPRPSHFRRTTLILLATPLVFLAVSVIASVEEAPIWGRWRIIMLSPSEEALLIEEFLRAGSPPESHLDENTPRDWLRILRSACGEDDSTNPPGTLMGMTVLNPMTDWRVRWVQDTLQKLEDAVPHCNLTGTGDSSPSSTISSQGYATPPVDFPLTIRPAVLQHHGHYAEEHADGPLLTKYGCLVIDNPLCNAFSLGFGPALKVEKSQNQEAPGVVVVQTGENPIVFHQRS